VVELLFVLGVIALLAGITIPRMVGTIDRSRGMAAARFLAARMTLARTQAVTWGRSVALRFEDDDNGIAVAVYEDGNRNGVQTADIQRRVDRQVEPRHLLAEQFPGVAIGVTPDMPAAPPVRLGRTTLLSFSPLGTATSGTIFVRGRDGTQWAVRVLGVTGRTRVMRYEPATGEWAAAF
jgi:type II secretory pathway pseudopilin PulG